MMKKFYDNSLVKVKTRLCLKDKGRNLTKFVNKTVNVRFR